MPSILSDLAAARLWGVPIQPGAIWSEIMSLASRVDRLDDYLLKRDAQLREYIKRSSSFPKERQFAFGAFIAEYMIREGYLPPLPLGFKTLKELLDRSRDQYEAYIQAIPAVVKRPPGGEAGERAAAVRMFDEWLTVSGERI
jgi:hypothetical protein